MFNFLKKKQENVEPQLSEPQNEMSADGNLANILGAQENDTNITAGVDAILDDDAEITTQQTEINSDNVDFYQFNEQNVTDNYSDTETYNEPASENWSDNQMPEEPAEPLSDILNMDQSSEPVTDIDTLTDNQNSSFYDYNPENTQETENFFEKDATSDADMSNSGETEPDYSFEDFNEENPSSNVEDNEPADFENNFDTNIEDDANVAPQAEEVSFDESLPTDLVDQNLANDFVDESLSNDFAENISTDVFDNQEIIDNNQFEAEVISAEAETVDESINQASETFYEPQEELIAEEPVKEETPMPIKEIVIPSVTESYQPQENTVAETYRVAPESDFWQLEAIENLSENPKVINKYSQQVTWCGDKYQSDLKIEIEDEQELEKWSVVIMHHYAVPLQPQASELIIDKQPDVVRYASLMRQGGEKLKIFNQSHYKFIMPQNDFFTVQGNVICGRVDETDSLDILDYIPIPIKDGINQLIKFKVPVSGLILGPEGTRVYFCSAHSLAVSVEHVAVEEIVSEYIPSLKDFDNRQSFVLSEQSEETEFRATEQQDKLVINVGSSLYGWNVHFDNEMYMSLRDALDYQARYKKLPSMNGDIVHGNKLFKFYGVKKMQAREKTVYYSYGRV